MCVSERVCVGFVPKSMVFWCFDLLGAVTGKINLSVMWVMMRNGIVKQ